MIINEDKRITMLFLSWRDIKAPKRGGAEVFTHEMLKRVDQDKVRIIHYSPLFEGADPDELIDGVRYIRSGNSFSVIREARKFYKENAEKIDYVVDQCNTHRFFTPFWVEAKKRIFFIHQLTREIWYTNSSFPVNFFGSITETPSLKIYRKDLALTVSDSTRDELIELGFNPTNVHLLSEGIDFAPWNEAQLLDKDEPPVFIYVGRYAGHKGIDKVCEAFGEIHGKYPGTKLWIVGKKNETFIDKKLKPIFEKYDISYRKDDGSDDVTLWGFVSEAKKLELMSRAKALVFPSIREGWGLIITEAAAVGTPSIVYNAPGTRDAVAKGEAGYLCEKNTVREIVRNMAFVLNDTTHYAKMRQQAYDFSKNFHWDKTGEDFMRFVDERLYKNH